MSGKRRSTREGRVLLVAPDSSELARLSSGLRADGWRVTALSRFEAAPSIYSSAAVDLAILVGSESLQVPTTVVQRLNALSRGTLPMWVCCEDPASYAGFDNARGSAVVGVLPTPPDPRQLSARLSAQIRFRAAIQRATRGSADYLAGRLKDPVTGACSRGYFTEAIAQEIRRAERFGNGFSILVCSLSGFRRFRKRFGEARAERFLVYATIVIGQTLRECDLVARIRENEFAILLARTQAEGLAEVRSRLLARFEAAKFQIEGDWVTPFVSLGACSFPDVLGPPELLLKAAYRDQRAGGEGRSSQSWAVAGNR